MENESKCNKEYDLYKRSLASSLSTSLFFIHSKAERKIVHFVMNDKGNVGNMRDECLEHEDLVCFDCKREPYLYVQICLECRQRTTTFCLNHLKNATRTCNIPEHSGTILRRFCKWATKALLISLSEIGRKNNNSAMNKRPDFESNGRSSLQRTASRNRRMKARRQNKMRMR